MTEATNTDVAPRAEPVEEAAAMDAGNVRSRLASVAAFQDTDAESLDNVAGSEFVDDRIRLQD